MIRFTDTDLKAVEYAIDILNDQMEGGSEDPKTELNRQRLVRLLDKLKRQRKDLVSERI